MSKTYRNEKLIRKQKALDRSQAADSVLSKNKPREGNFWNLVEQAKQQKAFVQHGQPTNLLFEVFRGVKENHASDIERLFRACEKSKLLEFGRYALPHLGHNQRNTYFFALRNLAEWSAHWIRNPEDFSCNSYNPLRYFSSLARHLFAKYEIPLFMDSAWFSVAFLQQEKLLQEWFVHLGTGQNIRTARHLPTLVTKKSAHYFMQAPNDYTVPQAFRFGQIIALGGSQRLCEAINATLLGREFRNEEFWSTVIAWFVKNTMLDTRHVGPIIDYIHNQRFVALPDIIRNGRVVERGLGPPQPGFCMKGRTPDIMLEQVAKWHKEASKTKDNSEWLSCGISGGNFIEGQGKNRKDYSIQEITNTEGLRIEGKAMQHCVASYSRSCASKHVAIYSLKCNHERRATIEVRLSNRQIVQARGKANVKLDQVENRIMQLWATQSGLSVSQWL